MKTRIFIERKKGFSIERHELYQEIRRKFNVNLDSLRYFIIYDIFNLENDALDKTINEILLEKNKDEIDRKSVV